MDGRFYVHDVRKLINSKVTIGLNNHMTWTHLVPIKVNCFIWRANMDRITSSAAIVKRVVRVVSTVCQLCNVEIEGMDHLLTICGFAKEVFKWIFRWCDIPLDKLSTFPKALNFADKMDEFSREKEDFYCHHV
ncbi:unnamed protein product [Lactuca saligna]|uniref:Reverse transcriptase zinc-binding domain-containing protein n=1 Tax=Lactuca saligna TaxID=75948 RepID=A0AA35VRE6_LACSI|nr:unnamed protein product [Lactuca saligna]